jgi:hypothetical protein
MGTAYCFDAIYNYLGTKVDPNEYQYMLIIAPNSPVVDYLLTNPEFVLCDDYPNVPNTFSLFTINDTERNNECIDVVNCDSSVLSPLDPKAFKRYSDITDTFKLPIYYVFTNSGPWVAFKDYVKCYDDKSGMYMSNTIPISKKNELQVVSYSRSYDKLGPDKENNYLVFDGVGKFSYLFDKKLDVRLKKLVDSGDAVVTEISTKTTLLNYKTNEKTVNRFYAHCILFKKESLAKVYKQYFKKHHDYDVHFAMSSAADDVINQRVNKIKSLAEFLVVRVGEIGNKRKLYEVIFDWDYVDEYELKPSILSEIKEGTFYTDRVISNKEDCDLTGVPIYIDEGKFINKIKIMKKWKDCIDEIIINKRAI